MRKKSVFITIRGRVQGVGFRWFVKSKADELGLTGWVRNNSDGSVELEATGDVQGLNTFVDWINEGTSMSVVKELHVSEFHPIANRTGFTIRY